LVNPFPSCLNEKSYRIVVYATLMRGGGGDKSSKLSKTLGMGKPN